MATTHTENTGTLTQSITVTVTPDDYQQGFEKKLKEYGKKANIPGFRKGMVPAGMIKKMYGAGIFQEEVLRNADAALYEYLSKENPKIFGQPLPLPSEAKIDIANPDTYEFKFEMGVHPEIEIPSLSSASFTKHKIEVNDINPEEELERIRLKAGKMNDADAIAEPEDVLSVTFVETDATSTEIENGIRNENSVMLKNFSEKLQKELMGKKAGDKIQFNLKDSFDAEKLTSILQDLKIDETEENAADRNFSMTIDKIGRIEKRDLDVELFAEIFPGKNYQTKEEVIEAIEADMQQHWDGQATNELHDQIFTYLNEQTKFDLPEDFLKRWLAVGGETRKTPEQVEQEFPTFIKQLRWTLISEKLSEQYKIDVSEADIKDQMRKEIMQYFGSMGMGQDFEWMDSYIDRMMKDEKHVDKTYRTLQASKLFAALEAQTKPLEVNITSKDFVDMVKKKTESAQA